MKKLSIALLIVLACTALAFAAARTSETVLDATPPGKTTAETAASGSAAGGLDRGLPAKPAGRATAPRDATKTGDIIIKGKAGSVTSISYGESTKPDASDAKAGGQ